jgi:MFS family permease
MTGIGLILGPMLGGLLYSAIGFSNVFYLLGSFVIIMSVIFCIYYPRKKVEELIPDSASFTSNQLLNSTSAGRGAAQQLKISFEEDISA